MNNRIYKIYMNIMIGIVIFCLGYFIIILNCLEKIDDSQFNILNYLLKKDAEKINANQIYKNIINNIFNSSVSVYGETGSGAGTIIKKTDTAMYILTCYHVISDTIELSNIIELNNEIKKPFIAYSIYKYKANKYTQIGQKSYSAEIYKYDESLDLAILKVNFTDENLIVAKIANNVPEIGNIIYTIGNPLGIERNLSKGIISAIVDEFYVSDGTVTFGNSGGGLFNDKGELIGVPEKTPGYILSPESGMGLSINLHIIKDFVKDVI